MIVRCVRNVISPHIEKLTGFHELEQEGLTIGQSYLVFGVCLFYETNIYRSHVSFRVELRPYLISPMHSSFFEVIDSRCPNGWSFINDDEAAEISPAALRTPHLIEHAADGRPEACRVIDEIRVSLLSSTNQNRDDGDLVTGDIR